MGPIRHVIPLLALLVLAACGSTPASNYYLLTATEAAVPGGSSPALGIGPITLPEYLNRNSLVYNRQGNELQIASYERWAEPLEDGVKRVLSLNLATLLDSGNIQSFPWHPDLAPEYAVAVTILSLDANASRASLVAEWTLQRPVGHEILVRRISQLQQPMPAGEFSAAVVPAAYSELLYRLSQLIEAEIRRDLASP